MYRFIQNIGDFFTTGYFGEDFKQKVFAKSGYAAEDIKGFSSRFSGLKEKYYHYKEVIVTGNLRVKDKINETHAFHTLLLQTFGYETDHPYESPFMLNDAEIVPVRHRYNRGEQPQLLIMEMQPLIKEGDKDPDGLFEQYYDSDEASGIQRYRSSQWKDIFEFDASYKISPAVINEAVTRIFLLKKEERPRFILMLAGSTVFLFEAEKWHRGAYLQFSLEELFSEATISSMRDYYALFYLMVSKEALASSAQMVLMEQLEEESFKNAYEVTKDLKDGVIQAVESLANEAIYYRKTLNGETFDETNDTFEQEMKDDCLTLIYRLLFIFYAEARSELSILPTNDEVYAKGYSLEMLRDMEQTMMNSETSRNGYFFHESLSHLFCLLSGGNRETAQGGYDKSFSVRRIDSPLFDDRRLKQLKDVKFRNSIWQEIIRSLSLSKQKKSQSRGRISYANLGINQLGSVYESLLAYRGFYAEEDYIEVHKAGDPKEGTFLVPRSRMGDFEENEILHDDNDRIEILERGKFVYRLNGRDRQKSASYYTPEVLTQCTVKYTMKPLLEKIERGEMKPSEMLDLKILEPAMGAAAFQNEVINQIAEAYLSYQQDELGKRIAPNMFREELQRVKAYIATNNVYGVDINPTAIELGKLSLWLNVIHKDMETPFFSNRLTVGNAVIGAWLKVYNRDEVVATPPKGSPHGKLITKTYWNGAPVPVRFTKNKVNRNNKQVYHFLLPDKNMLAALTIREQKAANPKEALHMKTIREGWVKAVGASDFVCLLRLSEKIDRLLFDYYNFQKTINAYTRGKYEVWGISGRGGVLAYDNYAEKERLFDTRYSRNSPYFKLKTVMDYWCALWYWPYNKAELLPTREQFWKDIEGILDIDLDEKAEARLASVRELAVSSAPDLFSQELPTAYQQEEEESEQIRLTVNEILAEYKTKDSLFDQAGRIPVVQELSHRYRFFHSQLEFIEVFWDRGGFDVICGNPPWLKLEFNEQDIIAEKYPEVAIRKISAPDVRKMKEDLLNNNSLRTLFDDEQLENAASVAFMNAVANYPLLIGQQTNLYKCVLENGFTQLSDAGFMGLLHPETIYDDPKGKPLRKFIYHRINNHFRFRNSLMLFAEVKDQRQYSLNIYGGFKYTISFDCIYFLLHPSTIDNCFTHSGYGACEGIKVKKNESENFGWNIKGHKNRIVQIDENELKVLARNFEDSEEWNSAKLVSIYSKEIINVLKSLSQFDSSVSNYNKIISEGQHETNAVNAGIMERNTCFPNMERCEMIYSGPHIYTSTSFYKNPQEKCEEKSDYDAIDLLSTSENFVPRTNYTPTLPLSEYKSVIKGFVTGKDAEGAAVYDNWIDYYKVGFRKMLNQTGERTLNSAILPPKTSHTNGVISATFQDQKLTIELAALTSSIVLDFFMKTIGSANLTESRLSSFPLGIEDLFKPALFSRTLLLNCLNTYYADLWENNFEEGFKSETWSREDVRLKPFDSLTNEWKWETPLRNFYERRLALVEIDVISAMALGLSLDELILIYNVQFPVLQQNEDDTWYDQKGRIVFTCSKGLTGVGVDRSVWNTIKEQKEGETYTHTIHKSELYRGQQIVYEAPYNKCDRVEDYKQAWAHFEKRFISGI